MKGRSSGTVIRIGLLFPLKGPTIPEYRDFAARLNIPVELHFSRTGGVDRHDMTAIVETGRIDRLRSGIEALRPRRPHAIAFACTCASFGYPAGARTQVSEMSRLAGVPATPTTVALAAACEAVGAGRVALAAPYPEEVTSWLAGVRSNVPRFGRLMAYDPA